MTIKKKVIPMDNKFARKTIKEKLILAGIDEIGNCGVAGFSLRQVAVACNVSCATPYNYFKNKEGFVVEIIQYIKYQWSLLKTEINKIYKNYHIVHNYTNFHIIYLKKYNF